MKLLSSEANSPRLAPSSQIKIVSPSGNTLKLTPPLENNPHFSKEQKQVLISHLLDWMAILDQAATLSENAQDAESIIQIGLDNQKQHLLLLTDRIEYATSRVSAIHALQETSEALGKESALVRYYLSAIGITTSLNKHDTITTEIRSYILKDILQLCGGTYLFEPA